MNNYYLIHRWINRDPYRFHSLRMNLLATRMGITLERYLTILVFSSVAIGAIFAIIGFLIVGIGVRTEFTIQSDIVNIFNLKVPVFVSAFFTTFLFQLTVAILVFIFVTYLVFSLGKIYPSLEKKNRELKINIGLHNAVAYMYAMRRGGAELLTIFRSLSESSAIYGQTAYEFRQVVRDCDIFGKDQVTAIKSLIETTPSQKLREFLQDMISIVESGGILADFLSERVKLYQDEAKFEQKQFLSFLALIAEVYVTVFIAGPLFLIVIMVVMGMLGASAILELTLMGYAVLPIGSVIFIILIDTISIKDEDIIRYTKAIWLHQFPDVRIIPGKGEEPLFGALLKYDRVRGLKDWIRHPMKGFIEKPIRSVYITLPIAIILVIVILYHAPWGAETEDLINSVDDYLMIVLLLVIIPYAAFFETWNRRIRGMERIIPDFLDRMAGINEVGITVAQSIGILVSANLGLLSYEIKRIHRDLSWGANFSDALIRFEERVRTGLIARSVTLITKASTMNSSISDVLHIAATDARISEFLKRERFSEMFIYTAIVYMSFFVFIFVIGIISTQFLAVLAEVSTEGLSMAGPLANLGNLSLKTIDRILYHTCLVQAIFSGLIAGLMGESAVKAGIKHAAILIIVAMIAFNFAF